MKRVLSLCMAGLWLTSVPAVWPQTQTTGATFGEVIGLGGTPSDAVLDELRGRIYLVNDKASRVDIYGIPEKRVVGTIPVGTTPLAAAMSPDQAYLYVTNNGSSSVSVVDLSNYSVLQTVTLPARPEGVAVGADGRALISTVGSGTGNTQNTLLILDRAQAANQQLYPVFAPPPPSTPAPIPATQFPVRQTTFRGKLIPTPDRQYIVGVTTPANTTYMFVYEVASGVILRSRNVGGQSTVLAMAPDGSRFMAGFTMFDTATLAVIGQQNFANAPFIFTSNFNVQQNNGGSGFSPDNGTLYSAFNAAGFSIPAARPNSSTLLISDARNLRINLGIKMPESVVDKILIDSNGEKAWALSESGLIYLPLSTLYDYPILQPETTTVFLAQDECNRGVPSAALKINNLGKRRLTFSVPTNFPTAALVAQVSSGLAPATVTFTMEPGRAGVIRQAGTNLSTGAATMTGNAINIVLASNEAINLPNTIRVYMNYRNPDQRGIIYPLPTTPNNSPFSSAVASGNEGLQDLLLDELRGKLYITNSGYNRIEVFDIVKRRFLDSIPVGQLPHQMALSTDGATLYVANSGGESISLLDLDTQRTVGQVDFPPIPRAGNSNPITVRTMAVGLFGLQFVMSNGSQWKVIGNQATVRPVNGVTPNVLSVAGGTALSMASSPNNEYIVTLASNGQAFLYDSKADTYIAGRTLFSNPIQSY
ncbi:MAG: YncE family protein, partial [Bryobacteraceae bacterium]